MKIHDVNGTAQGNSDYMAILAYMKSKRTMRARICHTAKKFCIVAVARALGVHYTHIYNVCKDQRPISPTLKAAMKQHGVWKKKQERRRAAVDVPRWMNESQAELYRLMIRAYGHVAEAQVKEL